MKEVLVFDDVNNPKMKERMMNLLSLAGVTGIDMETFSDALAGKSSRKKVKTELTEQDQERLRLAEEKRLKRAQKRIKDYAWYNTTK